MLTGQGSDTPTRKDDPQLVRFAASLPLETFFELSPAARGLAAREVRDKILVLLLSKYLAVAAPPPEPPDEPDAEEPAPFRRDGQSSGPRRRHGARRGRQR